MKAVLDTNIVFSALLKQESVLKKLILDPVNDLYTCNFLFVEVFKHREKIKKCSRLDFDDILVLMRILFSKIHFVKEDIIPPQIYLEASALCAGLDEKDTPFVALSLFLKAPLLTGDKRLVTGLRAKGFDSVLTLDSMNR